MAIHRPSPLSFTHSLAFIYFFMAHHGDEEGVTPPEVDTIVHKVLEWNQEFSGSGPSNPKVTRAQIQETWDYFRDLGDEEEDGELALHIRTLGDKLDYKQKRAVVDHMITVAWADGQVTRDERAVIELVQKGLNL